MPASSDNNTPGTEPWRGFYLGEIRSKYLLFAKKDEEYEQRIITYGDWNASTVRCRLELGFVTDEYTRAKGAFVYLLSVDSYRSLQKEMDVVKSELLPLSYSMERAVQRLRLREGDDAAVVNEHTLEKHGFTLEDSARHEELSTRWSELMARVDDFEQDDYTRALMNKMYTVVQSSK